MSASRTSISRPALKSGASAGVLVGVGTWLVLVLPAVVGWISAAGSEASLMQAIGFGSATWFLAHGQSIGAGDTSIGLTPVALTLAFAWFAKRAARRAVDAQYDRSERDNPDRDVLGGVLPGLVLGYYCWGVIAWLLTLAGPVRPSPLGLLVILVVPVVGATWALLAARDDERLDAVDALWERLPPWAEPAWRTGWRGFVCLALVGLAVSVGRLLAGASEVANLYGQLGIPVVAGIVLTLAQVAYLGNTATWALSVLAGPGFQIGDGALVTAGAAHPGLVPLLPIFGGLPDEADFTNAMWLVLLVPVVIGALSARWADLQLEATDRAGRWWAASTAAGVAALPAAALMLLGRGPLGSERLAHVGPVPWSAAALVGLVLAGALVWVAVAALRERRAGRSPEDPAA